MACSGGLLALSLETALGFVGFDACLDAFAGFDLFGFLAALLGGFFDLLLTLELFADVLRFFCSFAANFLEEECQNVYVVLSDAGMGEGS